MLKRDIKITFRLNPKEHSLLKKNVHKCKLSQEGYLRLLITGYEPVIPPPVEYYKLIEELSRIGTNLNQIAKKAHVLNVIDTTRFDEAVKSYYKIIDELNDSIIIPRRKI